MPLRPNEPPRAILASELSLIGIRTIVVFKTLGQILGVPDIELAEIIFQHVNVKHRVISPWGFEPTVPTRRD